MIEDITITLWGLAVAGVVMLFVASVVTLIATWVDPRIPEGDEQ